MVIMGKWKQLSYSATSWASTVVYASSATEFARCVRMAAQLLDNSEVIIWMLTRLLLLLLLLLVVAVL